MYKCKNRKIMGFEKYYKIVLEGTKGCVLCRTKTYIKLLWDDDVPTDRAITAIKNGN